MITLARHAYKSEKRKKELSRLKKQEEKRQRRFNKAAGIQSEGETTDTETTGTKTEEKSDGVEAGESSP